MQEHRCKYCGWWVTTTDVPYGSVTVVCLNRRCGKRQTVKVAPLRDRLLPAGRRAV